MQKHFHFLLIQEIQMICDLRLGPLAFICASPKCTKPLVINQDQKLAEFFLSRKSLDLSGLLLIAYCIFSLTKKEFNPSRTIAHLVQAFLKFICDLTQSVCRIHSSPDDIRGLLIPFCCKSYWQVFNGPWSIGNPPMVRLKP